MGGDYGVLLDLEIGLLFVASSDASEKKFNMNLHMDLKVESPNQHGFGAGSEAL